VLHGREDRLLGEQGQIARDLEAEKDRIANALDNEAEQTHLLGVMSQGSRLSFDTRTHRRSMQMTTRLRYFFLAARLLAVQTPEWIREDVLAHMQDAQEKMMEVWGYFEWNRLDTTSLMVSALDADIRASLAAELGSEYVQSALATSLADLPADDQRVIRKFLGQRVQNQIYRHLLLSVISNLWVDYLTRVEALRVSIGLEAYAQRDPLVQYKGRASEMFGELLADIRRGVISGMYTLRPRAPESQGPAAEETNGESRASAGRPQPAPAQSPAAAKAVPAPNTGGSKKKRHRH
jgi:preprotein translocase subunit SecA